MGMQHTHHRRLHWCRRSNLLAPKVTKWHRQECSRNWGVSIVRGRKVLGGGGFGLQHRLRGRQVRNRNSGQGPGTCRLQAKESVPPWLAICHQEAVHAKLRTSSAVAPNVLTVSIRRAGVGRCEATCDTTERTPNRQSMRAMEVAVRVLRDLRSESARADTGEAPTAARPPPRPAA